MIKPTGKRLKNSEILPYLYEYLGEQKSTTLDQNFPSYLVWGDRKHRKKINLFKLGSSGSIIGARIV